MISTLPQQQSLSACTREMVRAAAATLPEPGQYHSASLSNGAAAYALFFSEAAAYLDESSFMTKAVEHLRWGLDGSDDTPSSISLYRSIPGLGWALQHVARQTTIDGADDVLRDIDEMLIAAVKAAPRNMKIDVVDGAAGLLVYALSRASVGLIGALSHWCVDRFGYWSERPCVEMLDPSEADSNLGVAHGIPGLLSALAACAARGMLPDRGIELLGHGIDYLAHFAVETPSGSMYFPTHQHEVQPARLAWCYGALGIAYTFIRAAPFAPGHAAAVDRIVAFALDQFDRKDAVLSDACLCHGHSGAALILHRLAHESCIDSDLRARCAELSRDAAQRTVAQCRQEDGQFAFRHLQRGVWRHTTSLLEGTVGVCVGLMALETDRRPALADLLLL